MVKSTKRCLKKVLGNSRLTYEELSTVLTEIEGVINSRPLTYVYDDDISSKEVALKDEGSLGSKEDALKDEGSSSSKEDASKR